MNERKNERKNERTKEKKKETVYIIFCGYQPPNIMSCKKIEMFFYVHVK